MKLREDGFTLIELLFVMLLGTFLSAAIYVATSTAIKASSGIQEKVQAIQDVKEALNTMTLEIGMASYNPAVAPSTMWRSIASLGGQDCALAANSTSPNNLGIQEATANSITVEADLNSNSVVTDPSEVIRYVYSQAGQYITRCASGVNGSAGMPFLGSTAASGTAQQRVHVINDPATMPVFTYFDGSGNPITISNATIPNIRRIDITLVVETANIDPATGQRRRIIYKTSVVPMNHAIQSGN